MEHTAFFLMLLGMIIILMMNLVGNVFYTARKWSTDQYSNVADQSIS